MENKRGQQAHSDSKTALVEQIKVCLRSGSYSHALDLLRGAANELPHDAELAELEKLVQDGIKRRSEADRLITESQELFAHRKSTEAIKLLRAAFELDKSNSLARSILANALVEHAQSVLETDWWVSESLANEALKLNPVHPTAKTIYSRIVERKRMSSVDDWVSRARQLQSSGDLFAVLGWVAEGLAVHPQDPKLLQIQDETQRDQDARRRQARRGDLEDLRHMQHEIDGAVGVAAKQALAERIQTLTAKYWTDGEILSIANALLLRLGLVPQESTSASQHDKGAAVIFHVPPPTASRATTSHSPASQALAKQAPPSEIAKENSGTGMSAASEDRALHEAPDKAPATPAKPQLPSQQAVTISAVEPLASPAKVALPASQTQKLSRSSSAKLLILCLCAAAGVILAAAIFFFARRQPAPPVAKTSAAVPSASPGPVSVPSVSVPTVSAPVQATPEPSVPAPDASADTAAEKTTTANQPPAEYERNVGTLLIVAGQDHAKVFLNGNLQGQLTEGGQLRITELDPKEYVVQVSKSGFQDPPAQRIRIRKGEVAKVIFGLQPQPSLPVSLASLTIEGGVPGATVLVDEALVGTIHSDGTLSISSVSPGDHIIELRKERYQPKQFKKHFAAGGNITLSAAEAELEATPGELKIIFTPADANVAIVKGNLLKMVSSGVLLNLGAGTYTLTARTAERFTRSGTLEVIAGQSKTLDLSLAPSGMSKWDDPGAWKQERDSFVRKGGDFVLYGVVPGSGTFVFSAMPGKNHLLRWAFNYIDSRNYVLFQMDDNNFYRTVIREGEKTDQIIVPHRIEKKSIRTVQVHVSPTELVHQIKNGDTWTVLDRWTQPGGNLRLGKFGFYIPGNDQLTLSSFAYYSDLNLR